MEIVIIFTNGNSIVSLLHHRPSFSISTEKVKTVEVSEQKKILFVFDELNDLEELVKHLLSIKKLYILRHRKPDQEFIARIKEYFSDKTIEFYMPDKADFHSADTLYGKIVEIDKNQTDKEKLTIIFDELKDNLSGDPVLEAKLELLHKCLTPDTTPGNLGEFPLLKEYHNDFETFNADCKGKEPFDKKYIDALTLLRDKLLQDY